ncbi:hypothetical protein IFR05_007687 [Cadophora sp. M221]|nr:hypothetical protein IFR05_007687 [Cadophora sp. M221]
MMDPITALALTGNILQFIDFGLKATSKARDIYLSADGVTAENADLEALIVDIAAVTTKLAASSANTSGNDSLDEICRRCTASAKDLIAALQKLKMDGQKGKWKSARKGLKAVWGKKKVDELQGRLEGWRDEIQFHVVVQLRDDIDVTAVRQSERFDALDEYAKALLSGISVTELSIREAIIAEGENSDRRHKNIEAVIVSSQAEARSEIRNAMLMESEASETRHGHRTSVILAKGTEIQEDIRGAILEESENSDKRHQKTKGDILAKQTETQVEITQALETMDSNLRAEQESTRLELEQLRSAMVQIEEDIARRDEELKLLLIELSSSVNDKEKKRLQERSNAVTTALYALIIVYESLQKMLVALQAQAKLIIASGTLTDLWNSRATGYHPIPDSTIDRRMIKGLPNRPNTMRHGRNPDMYNKLTCRVWPQSLENPLRTRLWDPQWKVVNPLHFSHLDTDEGQLICGILDILDFGTGSSRFSDFAELRFGCEEHPGAYDSLTTVIIISTGLVHALGSSRAAARILDILYGQSSSHWRFKAFREFDLCASAWAAAGQIAGFQDVAIEMLQARCTKWDIDEIETAKNAKGVTDLVHWLFTGFDKDIFSFNVVSIDGGRAGGAALFAAIEYFIHFGFRLTPPVMAMTRYGLRAHVSRHGTTPYQLDASLREEELSVTDDWQPLKPLASNKFRRERDFPKKILKEAHMIEDKVSRDLEERLQAPNEIELAIDDLERQQPLGIRMTRWH